MCQLLIHLYLAVHGLYLVHATIVIGIISKQFLVSNVPSKVPNVLIMVPSNYFSCKVDFLSLGFPKSCQKFTGISVISEPVSTCMWKYFSFIFTFSLVFVGVFSMKISAPPLSTCMSLSSSTFFVSTHLWGVIFFLLQMEHIIPKAGQLFFSLACCSPQYLHRILYLLCCMLLFCSVAAQTLYIFLLLN